MAYTSKDFQEDLAIFSAGAILGPTRTRKMLAFAARKGISLAGLGARAAVAPAARALANPYVAGAALGGAALQTDPGQELLARAAQSGADTRRALDMALFEARYGGEPGGGYGIGTGYVPISLTEPGTILQINIRDKKIPAVIVKQPFYVGSRK